MAVIIRTVAEMQHTAADIRRRGKRIAVVPTMGALHEGHASLIRIARSLADVLVVTIFVNPTQFGKGEDFDLYPRTVDRDLRLAGELGAAYLFIPEREEMYPPGYVTYVTVEKITDILEGRSRPGHFRGVATIVAKLLHCVQPHVAVIGQKDAQQVAVIRRMVSDLNFDVDIVVGPIIREQDGLAMSSRNVYLTPEQRREAPVLYIALRSAETLVRGGESRAAEIIRDMRERIVSHSSGEIEYISVADAGTLEEMMSIPRGREILISLAVRFGTTRLIDNCVVRS